MHEFNTGKIIGWFVGLGLLFFVVFPLVLGSWFTVAPGERAVVIKFGSISRVVDSGLHGKFPYIESVVKMDVQTQKEQVKSQAASKDLQVVNAEVALNYSINPSKIAELYTNIGDEESLKSRIIDPAIQEAIKAATAKYTAEELVTKRSEVRDSMKESLSARLQNEYITVTEVSIVDLDFSQSFNAAIEAKVTAEQNALAAKNKLDQVKFEAEQKIATGEAEAKVTKLQSDAANNEKYVSLKQLEVQMEFAKKWNGVGCQNNCWGTNAQNPIPFLNIK